MSSISTKAGLESPKEEKMRTYDGVGNLETVSHSLELIRRRPVHSLDRERGRGRSEGDGRWDERSKTEESDEPRLARVDAVSR